MEKELRTGAHYRVISKTLDIDDSIKRIKKAVERNPKHKAYLREGEEIRVEEYTNETHSDNDLRLTTDILITVVKLSEQKSKTPTNELKKSIKEELSKEFLHCKEYIGSGNYT